MKITLSNQINYAKERNQYSVLFIKARFKITKKNCKLKSAWIQKLIARNIAEEVG